MQRIYFFAIISFTLLAGCGTRAMPRYEADALVNNARASATAIIAQAQTEAISSPSPKPSDTSTASPTATNTPSPSPSSSPTASPSPQATITATNNPIVQAVANADVQAGEILFNSFQAEASFACSTCHRVDSEERIIGPGLLNLASRAATRVPELSAEEYIYQSILSPSAYVVESFPDGLMPQNWGDIYSDEEIYQIIAYLLTL